MAASAAFLNCTSSIIWPVYQLGLPLPAGLRNGKIVRLDTSCPPIGVRRLAQTWPPFGVCSEHFGFSTCFYGLFMRGYHTFHRFTADCPWQYHFNQHHFEWRQSCTNESSSDSVVWQRSWGWLRDGLPWRLRIPARLPVRRGFRCR